eukprot:Cvel_15066.t2-p1 / transcript=Cvel_15066.t2 / gene=Cvel_15066 / organism=Chromera_velia_CCMP2878 / gene_product=hypothetical protein / transcript_product=hypothetical protein / location=Cvel_scaffold1098:6328-11981(+) / protein_length=1335 / sequence_SO=supercontig / SO=protein_coding / is_pseudo=false
MQMNIERRGQVDSVQVRVAQSPVIDLCTSGFRFFLLTGHALFLYSFQKCVAVRSLEHLPPFTFRRVFATREGVLLVGIVNKKAGPTQQNSEMQLLALLLSSEELAVIGSSDERTMHSLRQGRTKEFDLATVSQLPLAFCVEPSLLIFSGSLLISAVSENGEKGEGGQTESSVFVWAVTRNQTAKFSRDLYRIGPVTKVRLQHLDCPTSSVSPRIVMATRGDALVIATGLHFAFFRGLSGRLSEADSPQIALMSDEEGALMRAQMVVARNRKGAGKGARHCSVSSSAGAWGSIPSPLSLSFGTGWGGREREREEEREADCAGTSVIFSVGVLSANEARDRGLWLTVCDVSETLLVRGERQRNRERERREGGWEQEAGGGRGVEVREKISSAPVVAAAQVRALQSLESGFSIRADVRTVEANPSLAVCACALIDTHRKKEKRGGGKEHPPLASASCALFELTLWQLSLARAFRGASDDREGTVAYLSRLIEVNLSGLCSSPSPLGCSVLSWENVKENSVSECRAAPLCGLPLLVQNFQKKGVARKFLLVSGSPTAIRFSEFTAASEGLQTVGDADPSRLLPVVPLNRKARKRRRVPDVYALAASSDYALALTEEGAILQTERMPRVIASSSSSSPSSVHHYQPSSSAAAKREFRPLVPLFPPNAFFDREREGESGGGGGAGVTGHAASPSQARRMVESLFFSTRCSLWVASLSDGSLRSLPIGPGVSEASLPSFEIPSRYRAAAERRGFPKKGVVGAGASVTCFAESALSEVLLGEPELTGEAFRYRTGFGEDPMSGPTLPVKRTRMLAAGREAHEIRLLQMFKDVTKSDQHRKRLRYRERLMKLEKKRRYFKRLRNKADTLWQMHYDTMKVKKKEERKKGKQQAFEGPRLDLQSWRNMRRRGSDCQQSSLFKSRRSSIGEDEEDDDFRDPKKQANWNRSVICFGMRSGWVHFWTVTPFNESQMALQEGSDRPQALTFSCLWRPHPDAVVAVSLIAERQHFITRCATMSAEGTVKIWIVPQEHVARGGPHLTDVFSSSPALRPMTSSLGSPFPFGSSDSPPPSRGQERTVTLQLWNVEGQQTLGEGLGLRAHTPTGAQTGGGKETGREEGHSGAFTKATRVQGGKGMGKIGGCGGQQSNSKSLSPDRPRTHPGAQFARPLPAPSRVCINSFWNSGEPPVGQEEDRRSQKEASSRFPSRARSVSCPSLSSNSNTRPSTRTDRAQNRSTPHDRATAMTFHRLQESGKCVESRRQFHWIGWLYVGTASGKVEVFALPSPAYKSIHFDDDIGSPSTALTKPRDGCLHLKRKAEEEEGAKAREGEGGSAVVGDLQKADDILM